MKPTYITFEQAKWLKEKGFKNIEIDYGLNQMLNNCNPPEQWQVVEWLRVNHSVDLYHITYKGTKGKYDCIVVCDKFKTEMSTMLLTHSRWFNSPQEAYSAAFDYLKDKDLI